MTTVGHLNVSFKKIDLIRDSKFVVNIKICESTLRIHNRKVLLIENRWMNNSKSI